MEHLNSQRRTEEPLFPVQINDKWGYMDRTGKVIIQPQLDRALLFSEGLAPVRVNGKWGYIDKKGKVVIQPQFDNAQHFYEGLALVGIVDPITGD